MFVTHSYIVLATNYYNSLKFIKYIINKVCIVAMIGYHLNKNLKIKISIFGQSYLFGQIKPFSIFFGQIKIPKLFINKEI